MLGTIIVLVLALGVLGFVFYAIKSQNKKQQNFNERIKKDPSWEVEKKVSNRLENIRFGKAGTFYRATPYHDREKYERCLKWNQEECAKFFGDGALMVCTHQTVDPNSLVNNGNALYVYTPNAVFKKSTLPSGTETTDILPTGIGLGIKGYNHVTVETKKASVTGSAITGAVIGGTAGAVVGAVHAIETNANGGKSKVVADGTKSYNIQLFDHWIDCILISKEILKMCPPPPESIVSVETDTYWVLDRDLAGDKDELQETLNYLNTIVAKIKVTSDNK